MAWPPKREHRMIPGYDFMPEGWCGGCETCDMMPCPDVCLACSYSRKWNPKDWPATFCEKTFEPQRKVAKKSSLIHNGGK
jgi:hypothetical protein